jgi:cytochrome c oxidase subunit 2
MGQMQLEIPFSQGLLGNERGLTMLGHLRLLSMRIPMKMKSILSAVILAMLFAGQLFAGATSAESAPRRVEVIAQRFEFTPGEITLHKGEPVVLVLRSLDVAHGLRFKELGLDVKVGKGGTAEVEFTPDKAGTFVGHCSVFCGSGHGEMTLTLHVVE